MNPSDVDDDEKTSNDYYIKPESYIISFIYQRENKLYKSIYAIFLNANICGELTFRTLLDFEVKL